MDSDSTIRSVEITFDIKHVTEAAVLVSAGDTEEWIPKSQILDVTFYDLGILDDIDNIEAGQEGVTIRIPNWLAYKKGFI